MDMRYKNISEVKKRISLSDCTFLNFASSETEMALSKLTCGDWRPASSSYHHMLYTLYMNTVNFSSEPSDIPEIPGQTDTPASPGSPRTPP